MREIKYVSTLSAFFGTIIFMFFGKLTMLDVLGITCVTLAIEIFFKKFWHRNR